MQRDCAVIDKDSLMNNAVTQNHQALCTYKMK